MFLFTLLNFYFKAEPEFGDIDQSVLDQLPAELRQEILQHYRINGGEQHNDIVASNTRTATAMANKDTAVSKNAGNNTNTAGSTNALSKLIRISPTKKIIPGKRKRGRPPKNSVDQTKTVKKSTKSSKVRLNEAKVKTVLEAERHYPEVKDNFVDKPLEEKAIAEVKKEFADMNVDKDKFIPTFCGKSELEDIRPLIKVCNWNLIIYYYSYTLRQIY